MRRQSAADAGLAVGVLGTFAVAAITVPLNGSLADRALLATLVLAVAGVGVVAGRSAAVLTAVMAAFSFDFFHVAPIRVLHLLTLVVLVAGFVVIALITGRRAMTPR